MMLILIFLTNLNSKIHLLILYYRRKKSKYKHKKNHNRIKNKVQANKITIL